MTEPTYTAIIQWPVEGVPYAYGHLEVRADTLEELRHALHASNGLSGDFFLVQETMRAGGVGSQSVSAAGQNPQPPATNTQQTAVPQQPSGGAQPAVSARQCAHGARSRVAGTGKNGQPYVAHFCALPKGDVNACAPEFE